MLIKQKSITQIISSFPWRIPLVLLLACLPLAAFFTMSHSNPINNTISLYHGPVQLRAPWYFQQPFITLFNKTFP